MRTHGGVVLFGIWLGIGVGIAVGSTPVAYADPDPSPIEVWPADYFALGGEADGAPTNVVSYLPDGWATTEDQVFTSFIPGSGDYSAHLNLLNIPNVVDSTYQQVFDSSGAAPADGSFSDTIQTFYGPFASISGDVPYFTNSYIDLQGFGTGDQTIIVPLFFENQFVSDSAGIEDVGTFFGQQFTLFDIPAADAASGASDLSQLMTELTTLF
ncbi:hypothetical protein [Mycobacterium sp. 1245111.1]|uniref:hypothetical protein n=1 Tax=Mycobacterium sp. 1245111.1 TaxID=1834073 RepID=UPI000B2B8D28|nr:hypothetical protein [Mycobacterium sp. 1245111.1]